MNSAKAAWYHGTDVGVRRDAEPDVAGLGAEHADDGEGAGDRAEHLGGDVARDVGPGELAGRREPEGHRGVDVVAADVAEDVDRDDDDRREGQGDDPQVRPAERRSVGLVDQEQGRDRADANEDQEGGAEELGPQLLPPRVFIHPNALSCEVNHVRQCRIVLRKWRHVKRECEFGREAAYSSGDPGDRSGGARARRAPGLAPPRHLRARRDPRAAALDRARDREVAADPRAGRQGAARAALHARARRSCSSPTSTSTPSTCGPARCAGPVT